MWFFVWKVVLEFLNVFIALRSEISHDLALLYHFALKNIIVSPSFLFRQLPITNNFKTPYSWYKADVLRSEQGYGQAKYFIIFILLIYYLDSLVSPDKQSD